MAAATTRPNFTTLSYETHRFVQSYEKVHIVCGVLSALGILNACTSGFTKTGVGASCRAFHHLMVLFVRRWLQRMEDKDYACKLFSWIMSLLSIALVGGLAAAQRSDPFVSGLKARAAWMTAAMGGLSMLALQYLGVTFYARLAILFSTGIAAIVAASKHPFSEMGGDEAVLIGAFLLLGEMIGHSFEASWRAEYTSIAKAASAAADAGREAARARRGTEGSSASNTTGGSGASNDDRDETAEPFNEADFDSLVGEDVVEGDASTAASSPQQPNGTAEGSGGGGAEQLDFHVLGLIGRGASADVFLVSRKGKSKSKGGGGGKDGGGGGGENEAKGSYYAMKRICKGRLSEQRLRMVLEEMAILKSIHHPFIVNLQHTLETPRFLYLALTYAGGGDLTLWFEAFTPERTRLIVSEVCLALEHLHSKSIVYRDLKPENTLVALDGHVLLADFGVSKRLNSLSGSDGFAASGAASSSTTLAEERRTATVVGTLPYMAPEQWRQESYSVEVDLWAMAVLLHELLTSKTVGDCREPTLMLDEFNDDADAVDLVSRMLKVSPNERLGFGASGITQVKAHAYFSKHVDFDALLRKEVPGPLRVEDSDSLPKEIRREGNTGQLLPRRKTWSEGSDANPQLQPPSFTIPATSVTGSSSNSGVFIPFINNNSSPAAAAAAMTSHRCPSLDYFAASAGLEPPTESSWLAMMIEVAQQLDMPLSISSAEEPAEQSVVHVNHAFCKLTGYTKEELEGRSLRVLDGKFTEQEAKRAIHAALARGEAVTVQFTSYNKQMQSSLHRLRVQPVFDDERRHVYTVGMQLDVEKSAPERVAEFERLANALPSTMGEGSFRKRRVMIVGTGGVSTSVLGVSLFVILIAVLMSWRQVNGFP